jgi:hypothetical protein
VHVRSALSLVELAAAHKGKLYTRTQRETAVTEKPLAAAAGAQCNTHCTSWCANYTVLGISSHLQSVPVANIEHNAQLQGAPSE